MVKEDSEVSSESELRGINTTESNKIMARREQVLEAHPPRSLWHVGVTEKDPQELAATIKEIGVTRTYVVRIPLNVRFSASIALDTACMFACAHCS